MFKLTTLLSLFSLFGFSWLANFRLPRLTGGCSDYILMPFLGYVVLFGAAQLAASLTKDNSSGR